MTNVRKNWKLEGKEMPSFSLLRCLHFSSKVIRVYGLYSLSKELEDSLDRQHRIIVSVSAMIIIIITIIKMMWVSCSKNEFLNNRSDFYNLTGQKSFSCLSALTL